MLTQSWLPYVSVGEAGAVSWSDVHLPWRRLCRHPMEVESESDLYFSFWKVKVELNTQPWSKMGSPQKWHWPGTGTQSGSKITATARRTSTTVSVSTTSSWASGSGRYFSPLLPRFSKIAVINGIIFLQVWRSKPAVTRDVEDRLYSRFRLAGIGHQSELEKDDAGRMCLIMMIMICGYGWWGWW